MTDPHLPKMMVLHCSKMMAPHFLKMVVLHLFKEDLIHLFRMNAHLKMRKGRRLSRNATCCQFHCMHCYTIPLHHHGHYYQYYTGTTTSIYATTTSSNATTLSTASTIYSLSTLSSEGSFNVHVTSNCSYIHTQQQYFQSLNIISTSNAM